MYASGQSLLGKTAYNNYSHESGLMQMFRGNLSFHGVAFGHSNAVLQRMVNLATDIQSRAPQDPMKPLIPSSYGTALDSVRTFARVVAQLALIANCL
jgi:hypothetical protein